MNYFSDDKAMKWPKGVHKYVHIDCIQLSIRMNWCFQNNWKSLFGCFRPFQNLQKSISNDEETKYSWISILGQSGLDQMPLSHQNKSNDVWEFCDFQLYISSLNQDAIHDEWFLWKSRWRWSCFRKKSQINKSHTILANGLSFIRDMQLI